MVQGLYHPCCARIRLHLANAGNLKACLRVVRQCGAYQKDGQHQGTYFLQECFHGISLPAHFHKK